METITTQTPEQIQMAFPMIGTVVTKAKTFGQPEMTSFVQTGMTLRDYFAAQALALLTINIDINKKPNEDDAKVAVAWIASECYLLADAMMAERSKPHV